MQPDELGRGEKQEELKYGNRGNGMGVSHTGRSSAATTATPEDHQMQPRRGSRKITEDSHTETANPQIPKVSRTSLAIA